ncbi:MAG TPA: glycosyltransferase family A protein, partial [Pyrinomonadaceae bacterium]
THEGNKSRVLREGLVSIIVPTHNYESFIGETLENIQAQTYDNWECIVIDDGSTDKTSETVAEFARKDPRFRYLYQKNSGPAVARNSGLRNALGEFVQFWDADDFVEKRKIEVHIGYLRAHPEVDIVYGSARYFRTESPEERRYAFSGENKPWMPAISGTGKELLKELVSRNILVIEAPLLRRSVVDTVGYFDTGLPAIEDWDYFIRCAAMGKQFRYLDEEGTLALVRSHANSLSNNDRRVRKAVLLLREKIAETIKDKELLELNRQLTTEYVAMVRHEQIKEAVEEVKEGSRTKGAWLLAGIGLRSRNVKELAKLLFCALAAPLAPRPTFESVITTPASRTVASILRYYLHGSA